MSKIIAVSDIHIHDYPQRNPVDKYRLFQGRTVAQNIINAARLEGADIIVIAGDIIEKSVIRPYVQAEVKLFLDTLMSYFNVGYIIWGNHDQDNKGDSGTFTDSCLAVMLPSNLHYADQKELIIDNTRIAFSNWRPKFDLSWINGTVDVLFTHATISYSDSDLIKSQELDESKFDLAICGDIHRSAQKGKYVSIGIPQRCKMSDSDYMTGVIYDCVNKTWKWVSLDPGNLMKFDYTSDRTKEGWDPDTGIWKVFKPTNLGISSSGVRNISIPAWEEIGHLIDNVIISNGLVDVHSEVLQNTKNLESKEVDFNFQLVRFYCKNWRSIDEVELFFDDMDKILITGKNGAGKSSLLSALRYAFEENRFIKDFVQFGTKECVTEVDFMYQGKMCRIQRGSKKYGLWIDNVPLKYNNKKEFEDDCRLKFPFIDYMDIFFFDQNHHMLIGSMTPERKSEIISKFFKMDKIDAYNEVAEELLNTRSKSIGKIAEDIDNQVKLCEFIQNKLNAIQLPSISQQDLLRYKEEGLELQRKWKMWNEYLQLSAELIGRGKNTNKRLDELKEKESRFEHINLLDQKLEILQKEVNDLTIQLSSVSNIQSDFLRLRNEYDTFKSNGNKLYKEWQELDPNKPIKCNGCGTLLSKADEIQKHKDELWEKIQEMLKEKVNYESRLNELQEGAIRSEGERTRLSSEIQKMNYEISNVMSRIREIKDVQIEISKVTEELGYITDKLKSLTKPEEVVLPDDFMERMASIEASLQIWKSWEELRNDQTKAEIEIQRLTVILEDMKKSMEGLVLYHKLTGPTGKIYEEIMNKLAEQFSDSQVKYEVVTYNFRKKDHLDLASYFFNNGYWVSYQACSSGQRTVLDINFLNKVVTRMGLLIMDEFLKHLDPENHDICIEAISSMNIGCIMLSSHMESISSFNNKSCNLELNDSGITKITLT